MNIEQVKIYLNAIVDEYNIRAKACKEHGEMLIRGFERIMSKLNGAVTAVKLMGVDVKITYTEPTYYYSTITLVSVQ